MTWPHAIITDREILSAYIFMSKMVLPTLGVRVFT